MLFVTPFMRTLLRRAAAPRARETVGHFAAQLRPGEKIIDIGAGLCDITILLQQAGYDIIGLDIANLSCTALQPVLYDGTTIPFEDDAFDTALLLTVLHHTSDPAAVLREAARVARRVVIIEDIYYNRPHKYVTFLLDSLLNLEFFGHPHTNKTDPQWRGTFRRLGLRITYEKTMKSFVVLRHKLYIVER